MPLIKRINSKVNRLEVTGNRSVEIVACHPQIAVSGVTIRPNIGSQGVIGIPDGTLRSFGDFIIFFIDDFCDYSSLRDPVPGRQQFQQLDEPFIRLTPVDSLELP